MSKTDAMPYIVGFVAGLIVTGLVLSNLDVAPVWSLTAPDVQTIWFVLAVDPSSWAVTLNLEWNCVAEEEPAQLVKVEAFELDRFEGHRGRIPGMCRRRRLLLPRLNSGSATDLQE